MNPAFDAEAVARQQLPPVPRRVRVRQWWALAGRAIFTLLSSPLLGVGLYMAYGTLWISLAHFWGVDLPGEVEQAEIDLGRNRSDNAVYRVDYACHVGGAVVRGSTMVNERQKDELPFELRKGAPLDIRVFRPWPTMFPRPAFEHEGRFYIVSTWLIALVWNVIVFGIQYAVWSDALRQLRLVIFGVAAPGRIVSKRSRTSFRGSIREISFEYPAGLGTMYVSNRDFDSAELGGPVTVLYNLNHPALAIAYEMSIFEVR